MKIKPTAQDFKKWSRRVPAGGDLIFFPRSQIVTAKALGFPVLSVEAARSQGLALWTLQRRSWYGYALNGADYCVYLPGGVLESLGHGRLRTLGRMQASLGVPTLVRASLLSRRLRTRLLPAGGRYWITARSWKGCSAKEKLALMAAWFRQNGVVIYESVSFSDLPSPARRTLTKTKLQRLLHTYAAASGPNCFAAVAGAIAPSRQRERSDAWLHWKPLKNYLTARGYGIAKISEPTAGDVLIFMKGAEALHAGLYLGEGWYFEKPGQDFYEPYRVASFAAWRADWPGTKLAIWRKKTIAT